MKKRTADGVPPHLFAEPQSYRGFGQDCCDDCKLPRSHVVHSAARDFQASIKRDAEAVRKLPAWMRAGVSSVHGGDL